jgi:hypothetical protein
LQATNHSEANQSISSEATITFPLQSLMTAPVQHQVGRIHCAQKKVGVRNALSFWFFFGGAYSLGNARGLAGPVKSCFGAGLWGGGTAEVDGVHTGVAGFWNKHLGNVLISLETGELIAENGVQSG